MCKRIALIALVACVVAVVGAGSATPAPASPRLVKGIYDEAQTLYGNPDVTFPRLAALGTKMLRVNLYWGGRFGVSQGRPSPGANDPDEPGKFDWSLYDRLVLYAQQYGIKVMFSVYGTPIWANGGKGTNVPPRNYNDLRHFAFLAATRYSGVYTNNNGVVLPAVRSWTAWNEPNNPVFLRTQYKRVGGRLIIQSARDYAKICNAVVAGVSAANVAIPFFVEGQRVACGVTAPRGNNNPKEGRPSVSPIPFMRAMKAAGARGFDAYAHHPYYGRPSETPTTRPPAQRGSLPTAITLANIDLLIKEVDRLWGRKQIWVTEYGYQTRPQDKSFGVSYAQQARYLTQAYAIARRNPRIDVMLWFMLVDDRNISLGWQSGFFTAAGARKPAYNAFRAVRSG